MKISKEYLETLIAEELASTINERKQQTVMLGMPLEATKTVYKLCLDILDDSSLAELVLAKGHTMLEIQQFADGTREALRVSDAGVMEAW